MERMEQARRVMSIPPVKSQEPTKLSEFACNVFTDQEIASRVPKATYKAFKAAVKQAKTLDPTVADVIATAMKDWAVERGATHFTHWFQPIHISTAEKHEAFLTPRGDDFKVIHVRSPLPCYTLQPSVGLGSRLEMGLSEWTSSHSFLGITEARLAMG
jgi:glutamine synthetase type III